MAVARKASVAKTGIKVLVYGEHGTRKSGTLVDFAKMTREDGKPMRVLYLDLETGSIEGFHLERLEDEGVDLNNVYIVYTSIYEEVNKYLEKVINKEEFYELGEDGEETDDLVLDADGKPFFPDAVVIDGITVLADDVKDAMISVSEARAVIRGEVKGKTKKEISVDVATAGMEFKDYDKLKAKGKRLIRSIIKSTNVHVGITARPKEIKETKRDSNGNMVSVPTGKYKLEQWDFIPYEVNTVLFNYKNDMEDEDVYGVIENKDRTGTFSSGHIIKNPSIAMWQYVIEKNKNRKENVAMSQNTYDENAKKEVKNELNLNESKKQETPGDLIYKLKTIFSDLKPLERKALAQKMVESGISDFKEYENFEDIEKLKKMIEIAVG